MATVSGMSGEIENRESREDGGARKLIAGLRSGRRTRILGSDQAGKSRISW